MLPRRAGSSLLPVFPVDLQLWIPGQRCAQGWVSPPPVPPGCATELEWFQGRRDSPCLRGAPEHIPSSPAVPGISSVLLQGRAVPVLTPAWESGNCTHSSVCQTAGKAGLWSFPPLFPVAYFEDGCSILVFICTLPRLSQDPAVSGTVLM